jgi:hypothetical protein
MNKKIIAYTGIVICTVFFLITFILALTGSKGWLTAFEIITLISGVFMLLLILVLPSSTNELGKTYRTASIAFVTGTMILTNVAHFINLTVTEQLLRLGIDIPDYLQIGKSYSMEMALDYLAWGMFMGLAFLAAFLYIPKEKAYKNLRYTLLACGSLCILGFLGSVLNENLWYLAPLGYGVGTIVICIELLMLKNQVEI